MNGFEAWLQRLAGVSAEGGGAAVGAFGGASDAFARFAADYVRLCADRAASAPEPAHALAGLETLARTFLSGVLPAWPSGPPALAAASAAWSVEVGAIACDIAQRFAARLGELPRPQTLRATFDAWIDCAEAAFQQAAHGEAFAAAQGQLFNELVRLRAVQQELAEQAARLAGVPSRAEVDALHDTVAALRAELLARPATAPRRRR